MEEIRVESWAEFVDRISVLDDWAFRGQREAGWPLVSSLSRHLSNFVTDKNRWQEREARAIRIFRRKAHNYLTEHSTLDDDVRCIALMQHHGSPTRLLDFTKSPYVAAFLRSKTRLTKRRSLPSIRRCCGGPRRATILN